MLALGVIVALAAASVTVIGATIVQPIVVGVLSTEAPDLDVASTRPRSQTSVVLGADGSLIGTFRPEELHVPVTPGDIPEAVWDAVLAAEDDEFETHRGYDLSGIVRAALANIREGDTVEGGSTITQQLVKNLFTDGRRTLQRKWDELRLSIAIERTYTKPEILAAYLNTAYFGERAIGVGAAARTYFRKPPSELTLGEAALLAAVIPSPNRRNPRKHPDVAERARQVVLDRVAATGRATAVEVAAARRPPMVHPPRPPDDRHPYFVDYVRRWLLEQGGVSEKRLFGGGLEIHTTLDPDIQEDVRRSIHDLLPEPFNPEAAAAVIDPRSGAVRALVGGRDWRRSQVNLALGPLRGSVGRQPGSSFKPFVLAAALDAGWSPEDLVPAPEEYTPMGADKPVHNYSRRGYGTLTLRDATTRSVNTSFVSVTDALGPPAVARVARAAGIQLPDHVGPSIGIGAYETAPLPMAQAYTAFARDGTVVQARPVAAVVDRLTGEVVLPWSPPVTRRVVSRDAALLVTDTLREVVERGTGRSAAIGRPVAGKTGTTDEYTNAWFVGYTPQLVTAVWVGFREGSIPLRDINGVRAVTGGSLPAQIWRGIMSSALHGAPVEEFPTPRVREPNQPLVPQPDASGGVGHAEPSDEADTPVGKRRR